MRTLLLGSNGMLGQALRQIFASQNLICWDKTELDITREQLVRKKIIALSPAVIINAAGYTDVDGAESNQSQAFAVNETGVRNIAQVAHDIGSLLVHYSTDYVFPGDKPIGYQENDPPGPAVNVYGKSKLAGERVLKEINPKYYLLRTAWLYGLGGHNFVDTMLRLARTRNTLQVVDDQHGSPTYSHDLAVATERIIRDQLDCGIYHLTNVGVTTWYEFAREIFSLAKIDPQLQAVSSHAFPQPAQRPAWSVLINSQGPSMRPWRAALKKYLASLPAAPTDSL